MKPLEEAALEFASSNMIPADHTDRSYGIGRQFVPLLLAAELKDKTMTSCFGAVLGTTNTKPVLTERDEIINFWERTNDNGGICDSLSRKNKLCAYISQGNPAVWIEKVVHSIPQRNLDYADGIDSLESRVVLFQRTARFFRTEMRVAMACDRRRQPLFAQAEFVLR